MRPALAGGAGAGAWCLFWACRGLPAGAGARANSAPVCPRCKHFTRSLTHAHVPLVSLAPRADGERAVKKAKAEAPTPATAAAPAPPAGGDDGPTPAGGDHKWSKKEEAELVKLVEDEDARKAVSLHLGGGSAPGAGQARVFWCGGWAWGFAHSERRRPPSRGTPRLKLLPPLLAGGRCSAACPQYPAPTRAHPGPGQAQAQVEAHRGAPAAQGQVLPQALRQADRQGRARGRRLSRRGAPIPASSAVAALLPAAAPLLRPGGGCEASGCTASAQPRPDPPAGPDQPTCTRARPSDCCSTAAPAPRAALTLHMLTLGFQLLSPNHPPPDPSLAPAHPPDARCPGLARPDARPDCLTRFGV